MSHTKTEKYFPPSVGVCSVQHGFPYDYRPGSMKIKTSKTLLSYAKRFCYLYWILAKHLETLTRIDS